MFKRFGIGKAEGILGVILVVSVTLVVFIILTFYRDKAERDRNTFTATGSIDAMREVITIGEFGVSKKTVYVTIDATEYKLNGYMYDNEYVQIGQELQYTYYDGTIEEISVTREK